jgi:anti-sigma factor RsiW
MDTASHDTNLLAAHLDGRLGEQESALLIAHLAECAECRATLAGFARASSRPGDRSVRGLLASPRWSRPAVWLPMAAMIAIGTVAGVVTLRLGPSGRPSPAPESTPAQAPPSPSTPRPSSGPATSAPTPTAPGRATAGDERLLPKRSARRTIGAKVFRLEAGEWIDTSYDRLALLPLVEARTTEEQAALFERVPALRSYAALGIRVLVVYEGTVYRIGPVNAARP